MSEESEESLMVRASAKRPFPKRVSFFYAHVGEFSTAAFVFRASIPNAARREWNGMEWSVAIVNLDGEGGCEGEGRLQSLLTIYKSCFRTT